MSWYGSYGSWGSHVPVATKIARGKAEAAKIAKSEGRQPCPIEIEGRKITKTFWGLKWYENLNRYRDIANRLDRGATYVRNGSVADLVIEPGVVRAIVGGSEAYRVRIEIKTLKPAEWQSIGHDCAREVESLFDLLQARFSEGLMKRLTQAEGGLFPRKEEISMSCSCPDYATVCKHVAAVFYGVAARLDQQPELLFKLRNVNHLDLIKQATSSTSLDEALGMSETPAIESSELSSIFGIDLESSEPAPVEAAVTVRKQKAASKQSVTKAAKKTSQPRSKVSKTIAVEKSVSKTNSTAKKKTLIKPVVKAIAKSKSPVTASVKTKLTVKGNKTTSKKAIGSSPAQKGPKAKVVKQPGKSETLGGSKSSRRAGKKKSG